MSMFMPMSFFIILQVPLAIGFSVLLAHIVLIPITGCSINPARSFGPALIEGKWDNHDIFWYSPLLGAFCAVIVHYLVTGEINAGDQEKQGKGDSSGAVELDEDAV
jgi:Major intrinsic protein